MEGKEEGCKCIYTFDNREFVAYSVMKDCFNMSDEDVFYTISEELELLKRRLCEFVK